MVTNITVYNDADNTRTESVMDGLNASVLIYNADEEVMYSYMEGDEKGTRIIGADIESAEEAALTMDMSTKLSGLSDEEMGDILIKCGIRLNITCR